jgi:eukaryotic-like serine/threonine-protein kinase
MDSRALGEDLLVGIELGHYRIVDKIGAGGMGEVYRGHDQHLARDVAIKVLPPGALIDESARKHFHKEALILSQLNHPNIATIYDFDTQQGVDFLVMEYIPGITLSEKVAGGPLPEKEVLRLGVQLAEGLAAAHEHGVVHRDLKPGNLQVTSDGRLKILDFGLAKLRLPVTDGAATESLSETHAMAGTVPYMAPEQLLGGEIDARTDIHAAGSVLYEMATGQRPFPGSGPSLVEEILHKQPVSPLKLNHKLSAGFEAIVAKCLEKDPGLRYQSAREIAVDLQRLTATSSAIVLEPRKRRRLWIGLSLAGVMVLAIAIAMFFRSHRVQALTDKDTVVLADFANATGDPVFTDTLRQGLLVQLNQSPFLNILSDDKVRATLKQMGRQQDEALNDHLARDVCQRNQSKAFISGSIASLGSQYVLGLKAVNCLTGDIVVQQQANVSRKEDVLDTLGKQGTLLRRHLGESLASIQKFDVPLEQATTTSLEALQAYSLGIKQQYQFNYPSAVALYERAIELDPNFAMAYAHLATSYLYSGKEALAMESDRKAFSLRESVTERERLHIESVYYSRRGELEKAAQVDQLWTSLYPNDFGPYTSLGLIYEQLGQYDKGYVAAREALRRNPTQLTRGNMAVSSIKTGRLDEAEKVLAEAEAHQLTREETWVPSSSYEIAFLRHDPLAMERIVQAAPAESRFAHWLLEDRAGTEAYYGRVRRARELKRRAVGAALERHRDGDAASILISEALWEANFGNSIEARGNATEGLSLDREQDVLSGAALAYARSGDLRQAGSLSDELAKKYPTHTIVKLRAVPMIRAAMEISQNHPSQAIELLQNAASVELGDLQVVYTRGQAYLQLHRGREAGAEFQKIIDRPYAVNNDPLGALAYLGLARAYALDDNTAKARAAYEQFLTLWKDADPDVPIFIQAKAEYAKLQ